MLCHFLYDRVRKSLEKLGMELSLSIVYEERLSEDSSHTSGFEDHDIALLAETDMPELVVINGYDYSSEQLVERIRSGSLCFGLRHNERIVSFSWCDTIGRQHRILPMKLSEKEAFIYDSYTADEYRGRNLVSAVRQRIYGAVGENGRTRFLSTSEFFNTPAKRFKRKLGATPKQLVLFICLLGRIERVFVLKDYG